MPVVRVKTLGSLYTLLGKMEHEVEVGDGADVWAVLEKLMEMYPVLRREILDEEGRLREDHRVLLNGRDITHLDGVKSRVVDGDRIAIIPPVGGG